MVVQVPHPTIARDYRLAPARSVEWPARSVDTPSEEVSSKYRRLFPQVAAFTADERFLIRLGGKQGPCDGGLFAEGGDDASVAAGWPLLGQFVAHDITADRSLLLQHAEVDHLANFRTPRANLECLYGDGPVGNPFLYNRSDPGKLLIGTNDQGAPATSRAMSKGSRSSAPAKRRAPVRLPAPPGHAQDPQPAGRPAPRGRRARGRAVRDRRATTWHYQCHRQRLPAHGRRPRAAGRVARGGAPLVPAAGADLHPPGIRRRRLRYGHSQIRRSYRLQAGGPELPLFPDLLGLQPVPASRRVDWTQLFAFPAARHHSRARRSTGAWPLADRAADGDHRGSRGRGLPLPGSA